MAELKWIDVSTIANVNIRHTSRLAGYHFHGFIPSHVSYLVSMMKTDCIITKEHREYYT